MNNNFTFDNTTNIFNVNGEMNQGALGQFTIPSPLAADNWYQLGTVSNVPGRGTARLIISYTGGNWNPTTYVIDVFKDFFSAPTASVTLALQKFGKQNYIKEARLVYDGISVWSLEGLFSADTSGHTASVYTQRMLGLSTDWRFRTGTLPATALTTDVNNLNWEARAQFPVTIGGSSLQSLNVSQGVLPTPFSDAILNLMSATGSKNTIEVSMPTETAFKYRVRTLGSQVGQNPDVALVDVQPVFSTGLWYNAKETAAVKFWRGPSDWSSAITLNTLGDNSPLAFTASERLIVRHLGEVLINPYAHFTTSQIWSQNIGASASLNVITKQSGLSGPYAIAAYATDTQWPFISKNVSAAGQAEQFFVRHNASNVEIGNLRSGGQIVFTQSNVGVSTNLIVGTHTAPGARLDVRANAAYGAFRMQDTTQGANKVMVSDADGDATWATAASVLATANGVTGSGTVNFVPFWRSGSNLSATSSILLSGDTVLVSGGVSASDYAFSGRQYASAVRRHKKPTAISINNATFTDIFRVDGTNPSMLSQMVRASFDGTTGGVVLTMVVDILVNYLGDITVSSLSGSYTTLALKVTSDLNNGNAFIVQAKINGANPVTSPVYVEVVPYASENITFDSITQFVGQTNTHIHNGMLGGQRITGTDGLNDNNEFAGSLSVMGRLGIGTSSNDMLNQPKAKLHVNNTTTADSFLVEDDNNPDTTSFVITNIGNVGIGLTGPTADLHVRNATLNGTVIQADGVAGELFTVTDSLTGSLFSVNDVSGIPVMEAFSDSTVVLGNYQAPALYTTVKSTVAASVTNAVVYQVSTTAYTSAYFDYNVTSGTNSRAGTITSVWNSVGTVEFNEVSTVDIGNTVGTGAINFNVFISGTNAQLRVTTAAGQNWTIKVMVRAI